jgi:purine-nucleoside phosphorylase
VKIPKEMQVWQDQIKLASQILIERTGRRPKIAMFLGTGHGEIAGRLEDKEVVLLQDYPEFPEDLGEKSLVFGKLSGMDLVVGEAPLAPYLGVTGMALSFPVRVCREMGAEILILTAGAASFKPGSKRGDLGAVEDHLNFTNLNPLVGKHNPLLGPRFPDMTWPYDIKLMERSQALAERIGFELHEGVFAAIQGPSLPTRAEYRFLRQAGADFVGMSTVPEVIAAVHAGLRVLALVGITQVLDPKKPRPTDIEEMVDAADLAAPRMAILLTNLIEELAESEKGPAPLRVAEEIQDLPKDH